MGFEINSDVQIQKLNRQTYDLLTWLGDIGGLTDALLIIFGAFMRPFTEWNLSSLLLAKLFRIETKDSQSMQESNSTKL